MRILLIEDDETTAAYIEKGLRQAGHEVDHTTDGRDGFAKASSNANYDAAVVDRMLPGLDGLGLVKSLRASGTKMPVLILTALGAIDDRVAGLEAGADDYLTKPFAFAELLARLNALARRPPIAGDPTKLQVGGLIMDLVGRTVHREGQSIALLPREFKLLEVLMRNRGRLVTRTMLLERVWDFQFDPQTSVVETHMSRLRAKLDRPFVGAMIRTERGMGYILDVPQSACLPNGQGSARCSAFRCTDSAFEPSLYQRQSPLSGNAIFQGRDKDPEMAAAIQQADCRDKMQHESPPVRGYSH